MHRRLFLLVAAATVALPAASRAAVVDQGAFKIYRHDRALGAETFDLSEGNDSLVVRARQYLTVQTPQGDEPVERGADLLVSRTDFSVRTYQSTRLFRGITVRRALTVADTHYVAYRENDRAGEGESRVLPPGRLYVMDSQLVTLFDLICRSFHAKAFVSRSLNLLALGPRDTLLEARAVVLPSETIRWGAKPVVARKLQIVADTQTTFTLWVGPNGQLLRLSEPAGGLRAERDPPDIKRRAGQPSKPGG
ncbi:MAG: hypothetical protein ACRENJ_00955 [Candidatus Eiseniibacteriota bacterium]